MWVLIAFLIGLFTKAQAQPTVSVGVTVGNTQPSGIWWQQEYANQRDKVAPSFALRWDRTVAPGWSLGAGYAHVGNFHLDSIAKGSDEAYAAHAPYPLSRWIGDQGQDGLFVVVRKTVGPWYIEAGPMRVRTSFSLTVPDAVPCIEDVPRTCLLPDMARLQKIQIGPAVQQRWKLIVGAGYKLSSAWSLHATLYPTTVDGWAEAGFGQRPDVFGGPGVLKGYSCNGAVGYTFR